ncbi:hypothetical protein AAT19DRAFT_13406 [Rhodotorula toruloides]|uniref:Uncharacterized protein n=1 Tax=Rhodotorula toruloides TaxID=5286 RepID=A0A2T0AEG7_RHOTO|nr:hypothetical protein AAT19DRAFT_13406 [Rhodotorula toruloides]
MLERGGGRCTCELEVWRRQSRGEGQQASPPTGAAQSQAASSSERSRAAVLSPRRKCPWFLLPTCKLFSRRQTNILPAPHGTRPLCLSSPASWCMGRAREAHLIEEPVVAVAGESWSAAGRTWESGKADHASIAPVQDVVERGQPLFDVADEA